MLSGAGGLGKSFVTLALAAEAARALANGADYGCACGLCVKAGAAVLVSYEDSGPRIADRLLGICGNLPGALYVAPVPVPLFEADSQLGTVVPAGCWPDLWRMVRKADARLLVIDPASAALADADTSQTGPVRTFLSALTAAATPNRDANWNGCGRARSLASLSFPSCLTSSGWNRILHPCRSTTGPRRPR